MENGKITPHKAISKGHLTISLPGVIIMFAAGFGLFKLAQLKLIHFLVFMPGSIILAPIVAWAYWSFSITYWRIWAFTRVTDPSELKKMALDGGLIKADNSFIERTEIRTLKQKKLILELEKRVKEEESKQFVDDPRIPYSSEFKFSKAIFYIKLVQNVLIIAVGTYLAIATEQSYMGLIFVGLGVLLSIRPFLKLSHSLPGLILSNDGITIDERTYNWNYITNESAQMEGISKSRSTYLTFEIDGTSQRIILDNYEVTLPELRNLLNIYRGRNTAVNKGYE